MPGLLRAQRRLRPRQHPDPRRARRRRVGDQRPEGVDHARAPGRLVLLSCAAPTPSRAATTGSPTCWPDGPARRRGPAAAPDDGHRRVQRGVLRRRPHRRRRTCSARSARAGRSRWRRSGFERGTAFLVAAARLRAELDEAASTRPGPARRHPRPAAPRASSPTRYSGFADHAVQRDAHADEHAAAGHARSRVQHRQAVLDDAGTAGSVRRRWTWSAPTRCSCATRRPGDYQLDELQRIFMAAARRPSTPARARSNTTSSASGCSGSHREPR